MYSIYVCIYSYYSTTNILVPSNMCVYICIYGQQMRSIYISSERVQSAQGAGLHFEGGRGGRGKEGGGLTSC